MIKWFSANTVNKDVYTPILKDSTPRQSFRGSQVISSPGELLLRSGTSDEPVAETLTGLDASKGPEDLSVISVQDHNVGLK